MMMASDTAAREMSDSVMVPVAAWMMLMDLLVGQLDQGVADRLHGAVHVGFDNQVQILDLAFLHALEELVQAQAAGFGQLLGTLFLKPVLADLRASFSSFKATISSPAMGTPERPMISTGWEGPAWSTLSPNR
jgi:hypothetical protein